jgi:outer membrane protein assembly factor BamA
VKSPAYINNPKGPYNAVMRRRIAQIAIFTAACVLADKPHVQAQDSGCPTRSASASDDRQPSGPEISIAEVTFSGSLQLPVSDQDQIADSIKRQKHGHSVGGIFDDELERVKAGWQDRGYFKVRVSGEQRALSSSLGSQRVALSFHVEEGLQYTLGGITFRHNKVIDDAAALRGLFPINDGDVASRQKIAKGLDNLRRAYGDRGYINFTSVPDIEFDDEGKVMSLVIDMDEGKLFRMGDFTVVGLDEPKRQELLKEFPMKRGQAYDGRLFDSFMLRHPAISAPNDPNRTSRRLDERVGTVSITVYAQSCSIE